MSLPPLTPERIIEILNLSPHPEEGGHFIETYKGTDALEPALFGGRYDGPRSTGTCIYYLLTPDTFSHLHQVRSDEIFHFYLGDAVEMLQLHADGRSERLRIGTDLASGERPQVLVPRDTWQGCRLADGGRVALMGCTVSPGFEFADYVHGDRAALAWRYPDFADEIGRLTSG